MLAISALFLKPIVYLFGCTKTVEPYALGYGSIVMIGFPFVLIGTTLNSIIRADGSPKLAMASLVSGAVFNTVMDPVFIFAFHWGGYRAQRWLPLWDSFFLWLFPCLT